MVVLEYRQQQQQQQHQYVYVTSDKEDDDEDDEVHRYDEAVIHRHEKLFIMHYWNQINQIMYNWMDLDGWMVG